MLQMPILSHASIALKDEAFVLSVTAEEQDSDFRFYLPSSLIELYEESSKGAYEKKTVDANILRNLTLYEYALQEHTSKKRDF